METFISESIEVYIHNEAKSGNFECGDTYFVHVDEEYALFAIADGLGSGPNAESAASVIPTVLKDYHMESFEDLFSRFANLMSLKRGAVVGLVRIHFKSRIIEHSTIGNVRFYLLKESGQVVYPLPKMGYVSSKSVKVKVEEYQIDSGDLFFFHSDGINIRSPRSLLAMSEGALGLYMNAIPYIDNNDDSTFIAGCLL